MKKMVKKIVAWLTGMAVVFPVGAVAGQEQPQAGNLNQQQLAKLGLSKEELIKALKQMQRSPEEIKTVCAMCYKPAMPTPEVDLLCERCGKVSVFSRQSEEGNLVGDLVFIKRGLSQVPYKISVDAAGLCPVCGKDKDKVLVMAVTCFNCGKEFSWQVKTIQDIQMLRWLYLKFPVKEIDGNELGLWGDHNQEKIRQGAEYIRGHVFCPVCRDKVKLEE